MCVCGQGGGVAGGVEGFTYVMRGSSFMIIIRVKRVWTCFAKVRFHACRGLTHVLPLPSARRAVHSVNALCSITSLIPICTHTLQGVFRHIFSRSIPLVENDRVE